MTKLKKIAKYHLLLVALCGCQANLFGMFNKCRNIDWSKVHIVVKKEKIPNELAQDVSEKLDKLSMFEENRQLLTEIENLLDQGANPNYTPFDQLLKRPGDSLILTATKKNDVNAVAMLILAGAEIPGDLEVKDYSWQYNDKNQKRQVHARDVVLKELLKGYNNDPQKALAALSQYSTQLKHHLLNNPEVLQDLLFVIDDTHGLDQRKITINYNLLQFLTDNPTSLDTWSLEDIKTMLSLYRKWNKYWRQEKFQKVFSQPYLFQAPKLIIYLFDNVKNCNDSIARESFEKIIQNQELASCLTNLCYSNPDQPVNLLFTQLTQLDNAALKDLAENPQLLQQLFEQFDGTLQSYMQGASVLASYFQEGKTS